MSFRVSKKGQLRFSKGNKTWRFRVSKKGQLRFPKGNKTWRFREMYQDALVISKRLRLP